MKHVVRILRLTMASRHCRQACDKNRLSVITFLLSFSPPVPAVPSKRWLHPPRSTANYGLLKVFHLLRDVMEISERNFLSHIYEFSLSWTAILVLSFTNSVPTLPHLKLLSIITFCATGTYGFVWWSADGYVVRQVCCNSGYIAASVLLSVFQVSLLYTCCTPATVGFSLGWSVWVLVIFYEHCSLSWISYSFFQCWYVWVHKKFIHSILLLLGKQLRNSSPPATQN